MKITIFTHHHFWGVSHFCVTFFDSHRGQAHEIKMKWPESDQAVQVVQALKMVFSWDKLRFTKKKRRNIGVAKSSIFQVFFMVSIFMVFIFSRDLFSWYFSDPKWGSIWNRRILTGVDFIGWIDIRGESTQRSTTRKACLGSFFAYFTTAFGKFKWEAKAVRQFEIAQCLATSFQVSSFWHTVWLRFQACFVSSSFKKCCSAINCVWHHEHPRVPYVFLYTRRLKWTEAYKANAL